MVEEYFKKLRRIQIEERNKTSLARVDKDFYITLYAYIRNLERSVANNPFGDEQLLLNSAQRIAIDICQRRETKITEAARKNIFSSFHLFKGDNTQFNLLDNTPLNLTDEEETLYFSLMDSLKTHRYKISMDKFADDEISKSLEEEDSEEFNFQPTNNKPIVDLSEDSKESEQDISALNSDLSASVESGSDISTVGSDLSASVESGSDISNADLTVSSAAESSSNEVEPADLAASENVPEDNGLASMVAGFDPKHKGSDEVLSRLDEIKNAKVVDDEKYEPIEKQIQNQKRASLGSEVQSSVSGSGEYSTSRSDISSSQAEESMESKASSAPVSDSSSGIASSSVQSTTDKKPNEDAGSRDVNKIFSNPDDQFIDLDSLEPNYDDINFIDNSSGFVGPSDEDFALFSTKRTKDKKPKPQSNLGTGSGGQPISDVKPKVDDGSDAFVSGSDYRSSSSRAVERESPSKKPVKPKPKVGPFTKDEIKNTAVVIYKNIGQIVGIDEKVYGPFVPEDVVILPHLNAQILIDNNKAGLVDLAN